MFEEPREDPIEKTLDPKNRAMEKAIEYRMHAEIAAVYEGPRKFENRLMPDLDMDLVRTIQRGMVKLEKAKDGETPILPEESKADAIELLLMPEAKNLSTSDYHIHRRPGEVMMVRWLAGDEVETFYTRLQAHFEAGFAGFREEERQSNEWKQDPKVLQYLDALDAININASEHYLRDAIAKHKIFVLSIQTADEMNIAYLTDYVMGVAPAEVVGAASAPPDEPTEQDLTWFYKLYALRGTVADVERMCFFTFLQKSDESF